VYERANQALRGAGEKERVSLLEAWQMFETQNGDEKSLENVVQKIQTDDGVSLVALLIYKSHQIRISCNMK
jgi:ABC-type transporter Mla MlaB component